MIDFMQLHAPFAQMADPGAACVHFGPGTSAYRTIATAAGAPAVCVFEDYAPGLIDHPIGTAHLFAALEHLGEAEVDAALREIVAYLRPNGLLIVRAALPPIGKHALAVYYTLFGAMRLRIVASGQESPHMLYIIGRVPFPAADPATARARPRIAPSANVDAVWEGEFFTQHSSAIVNREMVRALIGTSGIDVHVLATEVQHQLNPEDAQPFAGVAGRALRSFEETDVFIRYTWPPYFARPNARRYVHMQPWEFGALPRAFAEELRNNADEIWCFSNYVRQMYLEAGFPAAMLALIPHGVDVQTFAPSGVKITLPTQKSFVFLFVGGTIARKGIDVLLAAYDAAFTARDDVCLIVKDFGSRGTYAGMSMRADLERFAAQPSKPELRIIDNDLTQRELAAVYRSCSAYVHPYRGEGFGLPVLEAMASGLPVIVTGGGSTDDFVDDTVGYRIAAGRRELPPHAHGFDLIANGWELDPKPEDLARIMRDVYEHKDRAAEKGALGRQRSQAHWTWARAAQLAAERIRAL